MLGFISETDTPDGIVEVRAAVIESKPHLNATKIRAQVTFPAGHYFGPVPAAMPVMVELPFDSTLCNEANTHILADALILEADAKLREEGEAEWVEADPE